MQTLTLELGARQACIDHHLELARRSLSLSKNPSDSLRFSEDSDTTPEQPRRCDAGSRIAARIIRLRNSIAALAPVPATTEADPCTVFGRFRASVETLWSDRRDSQGERDESRLVQARVEPSVSRRSLEFSSGSPLRHRRAGSSRI